MMHLTKTKSYFFVMICGVFILAVGCQTKERTGAAVGGATGAGIGAIIGGEEHRAEGAVLGGLLGGAVGYFAGTQLTEDDQRNVYDVLETTPAGETETWTSDNGVTYHVTPSERWTENGRTYRELDIRVEKPDGAEETLDRVAYKVEDDGKWQIAQSGAENMGRDEQRGYYGDEPDEERGYYGDEFEGQPEEDVYQGPEESPYF